MAAKKGPSLPQTVVPDGNGGRKLVDPTELNPQFILLCSIFFICDFYRYHGGSTPHQLPM